MALYKTVKRETRAVTWPFKGTDDIDFLLFCSSDPVRKVQDVGHRRTQHDDVHVICTKSSVVLVKKKHFLRIALTGPRPVVILAQAYPSR